MRPDVAKCVNAYRMENSGELPESVILFRDGVGEGQLKAVFDTELKAVKLELKERYEQENRKAPKLTYIVVYKKINTGEVRPSPEPSRDDCGRRGHDSRAVRLLTDLVRHPPRNRQRLLSQRVPGRTASDPRGSSS